MDWNAVRDYLAKAGREVAAEAKATDNKLTYQRCALIAELCLTLAAALNSGLSAPGHYIDARHPHKGDLV